MKNNIKTKITIALLLIIITVCAYYFYFLKTIDTNDKNCNNSCPKITQNIENSTFIDHDLCVVNFNKKNLICKLCSVQAKKREYFRSI
jgi:hypothetical protein